MIPPASLAPVLSALVRRPPVALSLLVCSAMVAGMAYLRLVLYPGEVVTLPYTLPLLYCLWDRRRWLLWSMVAIFGVLAFYKLIVVLPRVSGEEPKVVFFAMQAGAVTVAAAILHLVLILRERLEAKQEALEQTNHELEASNEELAAREEEIAQQNEELQAQASELEQQTEELRSQGEELRTASDTVARRERTLKALLDLIRPGGNEQGLFARACEWTTELLAPEAAAAVVVERCGDSLRLNGHWGMGPGGPAGESLVLEGSLAALFIEKGETGFLEDTALRPELRVLGPRSGPAFRSVLASPLRLSGSCVGALLVFSRHPMKWSADQARLAAWLGEQCARAWEVLRLREQRREALERLEQTNLELERRVAERTAEAEQRSGDLQVLAGELTLAEQRERRRIAAVLHDELAQCLAISQMKLSRVPALAPGQPGGDAVAEAQHAVAQSLREIRALMDDLSPPVLHDIGLAAALEGLAQRFEHEHGLVVAVTVEPLPPLEEGTRVFLFQAARELLNNVVKYATVKEARLSLARRTPSEVCVTIEDRGVGFDPERLPWRPTRAGGFGLFHLRERIKLLGGTFEVVAGAGSGVRACIAVPLREERRRRLISPAHVESSVTSPSGVEEGTVLHRRRGGAPRGGARRCSA